MTIYVCLGCRVVSAFGVHDLDDKEPAIDLVCGACHASGLMLKIAGTDEAGKKLKATA